MNVWYKHTGSEEFLLRGMVCSTAFIISVVQTLSSVRLEADIRVNGFEQTSYDKRKMNKPAGQKFSYISKYISGLKFKVFNSLVSDLV